MVPPVKAAQHPQTTEGHGRSVGPAAAAREGGPRAPDSRRAQGCPLAILRSRGQHPFQLLEVFAATPGSGNLLPVILDADDVSDERMALVALRMRQSETSFVQTATEPGASYRHRIWTVVEELPFAGHPSVGTAVAVALHRGESTATYVQQTGAGLQRLEVTIADDRRSGHAALHQPPLQLGPVVDASGLLRAFGLAPADAHADLPAQVVSTGLPALVHPPPGRGGARPGAHGSRARRQRRWRHSRWATRAPTRRSTATSRHPWVAKAATAVEWRTRCMALDLPGYEDPATGSAAGPFGAWVALQGGATLDPGGPGRRDGRPQRHRGRHDRRHRHQRPGAGPRQRHHRAGGARWLTSRRSCWSRGSSSSHPARSMAVVARQRPRGRARSGHRDHAGHRHRPRGLGGGGGPGAGGDPARVIGGLGDHPAGGGGLIRGPGRPDAVGHMGPQCPVRRHAALADRDADRLPVPSGPADEPAQPQGRAAVHELPAPVRVPGTRRRPGDRRPGSRLPGDGSPSGSSGCPCSRPRSGTCCAVRGCAGRWTPSRERCSWHSGCAWRPRSVAAADPGPRVRRGTARRSR